MSHGDSDAPDRSTPWAASTAAARSDRREAKTRTVAADYTPAKATTPPADRPSLPENLTLTRSRPDRDRAKRLSEALARVRRVDDGVPAGWVTGVPGITRNEALRMLGNGVVPQQGAAALALLLRSS